jgi:hypothetical protein
VSLRHDPEKTIPELEAGLIAAAADAWGEDATDEFGRAVPAAAAALWRIGQEPLGPTDVEP